MRVLENFLNKILSIPELKCEEIIAKFLRVSDVVEYLKFKKEATID